MRRSFLIAIVFAALAVVLGRTGVEAASEEPLDVIVHASSPVTRLSAAEVEAIFTRTMTHWSNGNPIIPLNFQAGTPERDRFDRAVLRLGPDEVTRFWFDRRVRGLGQPPKQVRDSALMLGVVSNLPGGIGYVPASFNHARVKVVARVVQGKVLLP